MRTINPSLLATYRSGTPTLCPVLVITRTDDVVFRFIAFDTDLEIGGEIFESAPGIELSSLVSTEGFAVDNAEFKVLDSEDAVITRAGILAGIWNGAQMQIGMVDWKAAAPVIDVLKTGTLGVATPKRGHFVFEFRDIRQAMQNAHETVLQPTCRYKLGDDKCTVDLTSLSDGFTATGTVDTVTSQYSVTDAARTEVADWFGEGYFTFTTGLNAGLTQKVKTFSAGVFVFWNQFIFPIGNDDYSVTVGCRFRALEDCRDKFDNMINFGGERNPRNPDTLTAPATS